MSDSGRSRCVLNVAFDMLDTIGLVSGVENLVDVRDDVLSGKCHVDPIEHARLRRAHWGITPNAIQLSPSTELTIWTTRKWSSLVKVWQISHQATGLLERLRVHFLGSPSGPYPIVTRDLQHFEIPNPNAESPVSSLRNIEATHSKGRGIGKTRIAQWANLWKAFCSGEPTDFFQACQKPMRDFPELSAIGLLQASVFPRIVAGHLLLSRFDELLLRAIADDFRTPATVFVEGWQSELQPWLATFSDAHLAKRLASWASFRNGEFVERRQEHSDERRVMTSHAYRLRRDSSGLLRSAEIGSAPRLDFGGAVAYDPEKPYVCEVDSKGNLRLRLLE